MAETGSDRMEQKPRCQHRLRCDQNPPGLLSKSAEITLQAYPARQLLSDAARSIGELSDGRCAGTDPSGFSARTSHGPDPRRRLYGG